MNIDMNEDVSFFLPVRAGSQRVKNKNTKPFAGYQGGLLENKLMQLTKLKMVKEVILSTNDSACIRIAAPIAERFKKLKIIRRPDCLCDSTTNLSDLIRYASDTTECKHILWGHVTTPLVNATHYDAGVRCYFDSLKVGFDSLIGVCPFRNFLLNGDGMMVNNTTGMEWPRTQDLAPLYEINHSMFIASRELYKQGHRSGEHPKLYEIDKVHACDIDWEDDFVIAQELYKLYCEKG